MADKQREVSLRKNSSDIISYDAIVSDDGTGNFDSIKQAIDSGARNIFVRKGTYLLNSDIEIPSNCSITGEDKYNTIIDLNDVYNVSIVGDGLYTGGSISSVSGDTVTGSGTSWLSNVSPGYHIIINGVPYEVADVVSDTEITISVQYGGYSSTLLDNYQVANFKNNISISNITITGQNPSSFNYALEARYVVNSTIDDLLITKNSKVKSYGFLGVNCYHNRITNIDVSLNGYAGFSLEQSDNNIIENIDASNSYYFAIKFHTCFYNKIKNCTANNCTLGGISLVYSDYNSIINANVIAGPGVFLLYSDYNNLSNCQINEAVSSVGIRLSYSNHNTLNGNSIFSPTQEGFEIADSDYNIISNNIIEDASYHGIYLDTASHNIISGNNTYLNSSLYSTRREIYLENGSTYNVIVGNRCVGNSNDYVIEEGGVTDDYNLISSNILTNYDISAVNLLGVNSISVNNIT